MIINHYKYFWAVMLCSIKLGIAVFNMKRDYSLWFHNWVLILLFSRSRAQRS